MFNTLLESKPKKQRSPGGMVASVIAHVVIISAAAWATAHAAMHVEKEKTEKIEFTEVKKEETPPPPPKPTHAPPANVAVAPPPPKGFQVLTAPVNIPDVIPNVDLTKKVTDEADFSGKGVAGGSARGVVGGTGPVTDQPYYDFQVDKSAAMVPGSPSPQYPEMLRTAGVEGSALVSFTIDTLGRADVSSFKVISSTNDAFASSVRNVLPKMRFYPAEAGGRKVKELVQQNFKFDINNK